MASAFGRRARQHLARSCNLRATAPLLRGDGREGSIYYKSILDTIRTSYFNQLFSPLLVWGHNYDDDMSMVTYEGVDYIPGDVYYFSNPDYDDPIWMGENSVFLEENQYFGHGVGIMTHDEMIEALNTLRKKDATESAFLLQQVTRLKFSDLYRYA